MTVTFTTSQWFVILLLLWLSEIDVFIAQEVAEVCHIDISYLVMIHHESEVRSQTIPDLINQILWLDLLIHCSAEFHLCIEVVYHTLIFQSVFSLNGLLFDNRRVDLEFVRQTLDSAFYSSYFPSRHGSWWEPTLGSLDEGTRNQRDDCCIII